MRTRLLVATAALLAPAVARAEEEGAQPKLIQPKPPKGPAAPGLTHEKQIEVSLRVGVGFRMLAPYDDGTFCGDTDKNSAGGIAPVCTGRAPFSIGFELGYGLTRRIDLLAEIRLGLEPDFNSTPTADDAPNIFHLSPGARFFFSDAGKSKLFTTAQLVFDFTGYKDAIAGGKHGLDFGVRNLSGIWFDLDKAYGFYGYVGETAAFTRWLRFELELGVGLQGRFGG